MPYPQYLHPQFLHQVFYHEFLAYMLQKVPHVFQTALPVYERKVNVRNHEEDMLFEMYVLEIRVSQPDVI